METREYRTIDKAKWGDGPWQSEPDKRQWKDAATGLPCLIVRGPAGALCGYVGVHEGHPLFKNGYSDIDPDIDVHGGLTFAKMCPPEPVEAEDICHVAGPGEPEHAWWFGFDCAHSGDYSPRSHATYKEISTPEKYADYAKWRGLGAPTPWGEPVTYRTVDYVTEQCALLAKQLAAAAS